MFLPVGCDSVEKEEAEKQGPLVLLHECVTGEIPVLVSLRNNKKVVGNVVAYDRHCNLVMKNAKEMGTICSRNRGKKKREGREVSRKLGNVFIRGDGVILIVATRK